MVLSAGSLLSNALSFRVRARICPNVVSLYGSTEASMIAVAPAHALAHQAGAVGYVLPDVSVEIADAAGNALPAGAEGLVRIRSPTAPDDIWARRPTGRRRSRTAGSIRATSGD